MNKIFMLLALLSSFTVFAKPVNINQADAKAISESLTGIGQKKAEAIVKYRKQKGPFKTLNDLINVKGIGTKTLEKNAKDILFSKTKKIRKPKS